MIKPTRHQANVYDSAIDSWIALALFLSPALGTVIGAFLILDGNPAGASLMFFAAGLTLLLTLAFTIPCRYTILDDALSVRCGLICYQVAFEKIQRVEPSASLRSGPALSLRRVVVATDKKHYILSPKDRDGFIAQMNSALSNLKNPGRS